MSLNEWKDKYSENHGFAFISPSISPTESIHRLAETLISAGITASLPIAVSVFGRITLFAYSDFDGPRFFKAAGFFEQIIAQAKIVPLREYLERVEK
jgi:hypothetical protein